MPEGAISNRGQLISDFAQRLHTGEGSPPPDDRGQLVSDFAHLTIGLQPPPTGDFGQRVSDFASSLHTGEGVPPDGDRTGLVSTFVHELHSGVGGLIGT